MPHDRHSEDVLNAPSCVAAADSSRLYENDRGGMSVQLQGPDPSAGIFQDLKTKNDDVKLRAAAELRDLISLLARGKDVILLRLI